MMFCRLKSASDCTFRFLVELHVHDENVESVTWRVCRASSDRVPQSAESFLLKPKLISTSDHRWLFHTCWDMIFSGRLGRRRKLPIHIRPIRSMHVLTDKNRNADFRLAGYGSVISVTSPPENIMFTAWKIHRFVICVGEKPLKNPYF
jgi:hypothetical protein